MDKMKFTLDQNIQTYSIKLLDENIRIFMTFENTKISSLEHRKALTIKAI